MAEINPSKELEPKIQEQPGEISLETPIQPELEPVNLEQKETKPVEKGGETQTITPVKQTIGKGKKQDIVLSKSETLKEIEIILSEGLEGVYQTLPAAMKEQFRKKGEETASKIEKLISHTKITVKKILELIYNWLKIVPGVNRFFLEQESKIKTDKILSIVEKNKNQKIQL